MKADAPSWLGALCVAVIVSAAAVSACDGSNPVAPDAGEAVDAGGTDAGGADAGSEDAGSTDGGLVDAGADDAGSEDGGSLDGGDEDAGAVDGGDGGSPGTYDFTCVGVPFPTTAPPAIALSGLVTSVSPAGSAPLPGAAIDVFANDAGSALASTTSGPNGDFMLTVATDGGPIDGYLRSSATTYLDSYVYPEAPISADRSFAVVQMSASTVTFLATFAGASQSSSNAMIVVIVTDCSQVPIAGATVSTSVGGTVRYTNGGVPSSSGSATDGDGIAVVFDVPPGVVTVDATYQNTALRPRTINARAGALTFVTLTP